MFNIALLVTLVVLVGLTFYKGKGLMYSLIIAFYPTAVIFAAYKEYLPKYLKLVSDTSFHVYLSEAFIFLVIFVLVFLVTRRLSHYDEPRSGIAGFIDALLLSVSVMLLVMTITFHVLPAMDIYSLTADVRAFFVSSQGNFVCVLAPIVVLLTVTRRG